MEVSSGIIVRVKHLREAKICMRGARIWFAYHDIAWTRLMAGEVMVEEIEATGDKMALDVARIARAEHG